MITITVTRKPLSEETVAANVLKHGTGALNIDAIRIDGLSGDELFRTPQRQHTKEGAVFGRKPVGQEQPMFNPKGRWPANMVLGDTCAILEQFPDTKSGGYPPEGNQRSHVSTYSKPNARGERKFTSSEGSAARYFRLVQDDLEATREDS